MQAQRPLYWAVHLPFLRFSASRLKEELLSDRCRSSNHVTKLATDPLNSEDIHRWQVQQDVFEELGRFEDSLSRAVDGHVSRDPHAGWCLALRFLHLH